MKKITLTLLAVLSVIILFAQTPYAFEYQAVARNISGEILSNQDVAFQISILEGSTTNLVLICNEDTFMFHLELVC